MNQVLFIFITCNILLSNIIICQNNIFTPTPKYPELFKSIPTIDSNTPEWAVLLYQTNPNIYKIEAAYKKYYKQNVYKKTVHGQNYKYFMRAVFSNDYIQADGSILIKEEPSLASNNQSSKKLTDSANWQFIGPFETYDSTGKHKRSHQANVYTLEQSKSNPEVMLAGCETGASFISLDKGENWSVTADALGLSGGVNTVAIDPKNDQIMYLANENSLYKTTNRGNQWFLIHNESNLSLTDISINPDNTEDLLTAGTKGLYRSTDGGNNWNQIIIDKCWDIERKTNDPNTVFVSKTNPITNVTEIWKSIDNGISFSARKSGWFTPIGTKAVANQGARIGVSEADPNRIYALLLGSDENYATDVNFLGVYRSDNAGETWYLPYDGDRDGVPNNNPGGPYSNDNWCLSCFGFGNSLTGGGGYDQGFYNASIDVSDTNPDNFLVGMLSLFKSTDAGATYTPWGGYRCEGCETNLQHPDIQEIEINGNDVWVASDGGIDKYDGDFNYIESKTTGIDASENWGFGQGWNEDIIVGGRYHNGNTAYRPSYTNGKFLRLGGGEAPTGYVSTDSKVAIFSDINDKVIPNQLSEAVTDATINISMYPNQHYYDISQRSELVNDPRYTNVHYIGKDNKLWKTEDSGISYSLIKEFGTEENNLVQGIEIPRDNPDYIYVTQYQPKKNNKLWKTTDGGINWVELTKPEGDNGNYILIQVSEANKNEIYIAYSNDWNNNNKIFKSTDGGNTWHNITTKTLDRSVQHLLFQNGTDGGVYAVTHKTIYYKNNQMNDWETYDNGLPTRKSFNKLLPFYKESKLRGATFNRGFVETSLYEKFLPVAQPLANKEHHHCSKDTVYFDDYSVLKHKGAKWQWNFPGASYVSSTTVRNPKVLYNKTGNYNVSLSVTDANGNSSGKTVNSMIKFEKDACKTEENSGQAIVLEKNTPNYLYTNDIDLDNISHFTVTAWIKPSEITQSNFAAIFFAKDNEGKACSLNFLADNNHLGIHWNNSEWQWDSGLEVPKNKWSYVAMVVTPNNITVYLNEQKAVHEYTSTTTHLNKAVIGSYDGWSSRVFDGLIDEVAIWDSALTDQDIRLKRHLVKLDNEANLQAYYQMNSILNGEIYDIINQKNMLVRNELTLTHSTVPVSQGISEKATINTVGEYNFTKTGVRINFNKNTIPEEAIYVSKLNGQPENHEFNNGLDYYWIINNYEAFLAPTNIQFISDSISENSIAENFKLYTRGSNAHEIKTWENNNFTASAINTSAEAIHFEFTNLENFGQFFITNDTSTTTPEGEENEEETLGFDPILKTKSKIPKAHINGSDVYFPSLEESFQITIYSITGKEILKQKISDHHFSMEKFASAIYLYWIETDNKLYSGKFITN